MSLRRTTFLAGSAAVTILFSFATQWYVLTALGAGAASDAFFAAYAAPQLVLALASDPLSLVLVPMLAIERGRRFWERAWSMLLLASLAFTVLAGLLFVSARWWVPLMFPGFSGERLALTTTVSRILVLGMGLTGIGAMLRTIMYARERFIWAGASSVIGAIAGFLALLWALPRHGIEGAAWASNLRFGLETVLLAPAIAVVALPSLRNPVIGEAVRRARPLVVGAAYFRSDIVVDRVLSSMAPAGGLSLLSLAHQTFSAAGQVLNKSVVAPLGPQLAKAAHQQDWGGFRARYRSAMTHLGVVVAVGILALAVLGSPSLSLVFGVRSVTADDVGTLWWLMIAMSGFLVGDSLGHVLATAFYALGDTRTPTRISVVVYTIGVVVKLAAFWVAGLIGLAVGTSLNYLFRLALLARFLDRRLADVEKRGRAAAPGGTAVEPIDTEPASPIIFS